VSTYAPKTFVGLGPVETGFVSVPFDNKLIKLVSLSVDEVEKRKLKIEVV